MNQFFTVLTRAFYNDDVVNSTWEGAWPNQNLDAAEKHNLFNGIVSWRGDMEVTREIMAQMMYNVMIDKWSEGTSLNGELSALANGTSPRQNTSASKRDSLFFMDFPHLSCFVTIV